jgi:hypothetical protein
MHAQYTGVGKLEEGEVFQIGPYIVLECTSCHRGRSLASDEANHARDDLKGFLSTTWCCPECGEKSTFQEAMIQGMMTRNTLVSATAVGDILLYGRTVISVGRESIVKLSQEVPLITSVNLTAIGKGARLAWNPAGSEGFVIISSTVTTPVGQEADAWAQPGENIEVNWGLSGRSNWSNLDVSIWQFLLAQAREQLDRKGYDLSILSSVTALESYVDILILDAFGAAGVKENVSRIVLERTYGIKRKLTSLLPEISGISLKGSGLLPRLDKVDQNRNAIAHGQKVGSTESEAYEAFEVVLRSMFYLLPQSLAT